MCCDLNAQTKKFLATA